MISLIPSGRVLSFSGIPDSPFLRRLWIWGLPFCACEIRETHYFQTTLFLGWILIDKIIIPQNAIFAKSNNPTTLTTAQQFQARRNRTDRQVFFVHITIKSKATSEKEDVKMTHRKPSKLSLGAFMYDSVPQRGLRKVRGCVVYQRWKQWWLTTTNRIDFPLAFMPSPLKVEEFGRSVVFSLVCFSITKSTATKQHNFAGIAQWLERRTRDWKVAGSNPCWSGGRIFFSRVNFLCWLLFRYPFRPRVTAVARKRPRSFCQKRRWQVTAKHAYTLRMWLCMKWHGAWLYGVHRTRRDWLSLAADSCGTSHASAVSTPLRWIFKNAL